MPQLKIFQNTREVHTIPGVLAPVTLTAGATTATSNLITVASTAGVYPGMAVACPHVPAGAFVAAVVSATVLELALSVFNRTTGVWSTTGANANASTTATGLTVMAFGYHPFCIVEQSVPLGVWRNEIRNSSMTLPTQNSIAAGGSILLSGPAVLQVPALLTSAQVDMDVAAPFVSTVTPTYDVKDDTCATTPLKRHNAEPWGVRIVVSTGGQMNHFPAHMDWNAFYNGADA